MPFQFSSQEMVLLHIKMEAPGCLEAFFTVAGGTGIVPASAFDAFYDFTSFPFGIADPA